MKEALVDGRDVVRLAAAGLDGSPAQGAGARRALSRAAKTSLAADSRPADGRIGRLRTSCWPLQELGALCGGPGRGLDGPANIVSLLCPRKHVSKTPST